MSHSPMDRPHQASRFERWPRAAAGFAILLASLALLGWWLDQPLLRNGLGIGVAMNPATAVAFLLAGLALWPAADGSPSWLRRLGTGCAVAVMAIAALKLGAVVFEWPLAIDRVLFAARLDTTGDGFTNRMASNTAFSFLVLGLGLLLLRHRNDTIRILGRSLALLSGLGGLVTLVGYLYRQMILAGVPGQIPMAVNTALCFVVLALGAAAAGGRAEPEESEPEDRHALRRRVNLALVVAVSILVMTTAVSVWSAIRLGRAAAERRASFQRRTELDGLLASLQNAELSQRGYLLAGRPELLLAYRAAQDSLAARLERARGSLAGEPARSHRLASLDSLVRLRLAELNRSLELGRQGSLPELAAMVGNESLLTRIRAELAALTAREDALVASWNGRRRIAERIALGTTFTAGLLAIFFLCLAAQAINRDLKKRIAAESELRESQVRLAQIVDLIPGMVFLKDPRELRFIRLNKAGEELLGTGRDAVLGKTVFDLFPRDQAEAFNAEDRAVLASSEVLDIPEEVVHTRHKGRRLLHTKKVAVRDERGTGLYLLGVSEDITERRQLEAERDRFFTLSLDMLCIAHADGYFKRLNPAFTQTLGWSVEELLARPFLSFVHPDDQAATLREVERQTVAGEEVLHFENRYLHKNGSWRVLSWKSVPYPGGLLYATARDVTELRDAEEALRRSMETANAANRAKSEFLAKMSHELRTPLNSIIGFSEILEDETVGPLTEKQRRYVANVLTSGRNLLQLINDILDLSKVEAGRMELVTTEFDVATVLDQVRSIVTPLADPKRLALEIQVPDSLPLLLADQAKFKQILFNLVGNAIKFTPEGGRIEVVARRVAGRLEVSVADTGIGIAPEDQERIFGEFEQVGRGAAGSQQGTGLGLALTRKLVELHGGQLSLTSAVGLGSTFRFTLPYPSLAAAPAREPSEPAAASSTAPLVLVVDNDRGARDLIGHYLEEHGYRAASAATGEEAIRLALALGPAAITLDILMPDRDGLKILAQLKGEPATRNIPVVVVSVTDRHELGFSLGAADWLVKPVQPGALIAALERCTGQAPREEGRARRVLVIDDELSAIEYVKELLEPRDFTVLTAAGGRAGIAQALSRQPDLIILDLLMPEVNGFDVIKALRQDPTTWEIPIVILTALDLTSAEVRGLGNSVQGLLAKSGPGNLLVELARVCAAPSGPAGGGVPGP